MIRIGVISDTHGSLSSADRCVSLAGEVDGWFHLGDFASDAKHIAGITGKPVYSVLGNCDSFSFVDGEENVFPMRQKRVTSERVVTVDGVRIFLCHGHRYGVDFDPYRLNCRAEELNCAAALYGHTHRGELSAFGRVLTLNPGSPSRPRGGSKQSFAILEIERGDVNARIITL